MSIKKNFFLVCVIMLIAGGCSTLPTVRVRRPWTRSLDLDSIDNTKAIKIIVAESSSPLTGSEDIVSQKAISSLSNLLKRKGFSINNDTYEYGVKLSYKTEKNEKMSMSAYSVGGNTLITDQVLSFVHTISIEFITRNDNVLWEGKSFWESNTPDVLKGIVSAMQLLLSDLPTNQAVPSEIQEVKDTHYKNYYVLNCRNKWFSCPALPYWIVFEYAESNKDVLGIVSIPAKIKDRKAMAAYVDLVQTAEYALPSGSEKDWKDPYKKSLWENATLCGQYLIGPEKTPINVIVKLEGQESGYHISECKIATDEEYEKFNQKLNKWHEVLAEYNDMFRK